MNDYESPAAAWWREWHAYVWGAVAIAAVVGLIAWGICAGNRDRAECLSLHTRCELGDMEACISCAPCGGEIGGACESQVRAAAMRKAQ